MATPDCVGSRLAASPGGSGLRGSGLRSSGAVVGSGLRWLRGYGDPWLSRVSVRGVRGPWRPRVASGLAPWRPGYVVGSGDAVGSGLRWALVAAASACDGAPGCGGAPGCVAPGPWWALVCGGFGAMATPGCRGSRSVGFAVRGVPGLRRGSVRGVPGPWRPRIAVGPASRRAPLGPGRGAPRGPVRGWPRSHRGAPRKAIVAPQGGPVVGKPAGCGTSSRPNRSFTVKAPHRERPSAQTAPPPSGSPRPVPNPPQGSGRSASWRPGPTRPTEK